MPETTEHNFIIVEVKDGKWDAYSLNNPPTDRDRWLLGLIRMAGGINETVEEGRWIFTAAGLPGTDAAVTKFERAPEELQEGNWNPQES